MSDWTPELANETRERCDGATLGPWERTPNDGIKAWLEPPADVPGYHRIAETLYWRDSEFVAHARTDLPAALDRIEAQDEEIERLRTTLAAYRSAMRCGEPETDQLRAMTGWATS